MPWGITYPAQLGVQAASLCSAGECSSIRIAICASICCCGQWIGKWAAASQIGARGALRMQRPRAAPGGTPSRAGSRCVLPLGGRCNFAGRSLTQGGAQQVWRTCRRQRQGILYRIPFPRARFGWLWVVVPAPEHDSALLAAEALLCFVRVASYVPLRQHTLFALGIYSRGGRHCHTYLLPATFSQSRASSAKRGAWERRF